MSRTLTAPEEVRRVDGRAGYLADLDLGSEAGALQCAFVRSPFPHAAVRGVDTAAALSLPGVVAVFTGADLAAVGLRPVASRGAGQRPYLWHPLPADAARFVGEPVAVTIAQTRAQAEDAADAVNVAYEQLQAATGVGPGAPAVHPEAPDNVLFEGAHVHGDPEAALADAHLVLDRTFRMPRQTALPLETRGVIAAHDPAAGTFTLVTSTQIPHVVRQALTGVLDVPVDRIHVITPAVGGGFGLKLQVFAEELILPVLARQLGATVRWVEDRRENLMASAHAHDVRLHLRSGFAVDGTLLAVVAEIDADVGAHAVYPLSASLDAATAAASLFGAYRFDHLRYRARGLATNRCPAGAYRGVGVNAAVFATERTMDQAAAALGLDPVGIRRRNLPAREEFPFRGGSGRTYDSGAYAELLEALLARPAVAAWRRRRGEDSTLGLGFATFNEHCGTGAAEYRARGAELMPGTDAATVRVTAEGRLQVLASAAEAGQRHHETYRLLAERELGIPAHLVDVVEGDTGRVPPGSGTFASRHAVGNLEALGRAMEELRLQLVELASAQLGASGSAVRLAGGAAEAGGGRVPLAELRRRFVLSGPRELESTATVDMRQVYPAGAHLAVVRVDPETLIVRVLAYVAVEDCGRVVNPDAVHEQMVGGIVMGLGKVLYEEVTYDAEAVVQTSTLLDYPVPLAADLPEIEVDHLEVPTPLTRYGTKGAAEAGTIGACGAIPNAIADALRRRGLDLTALPATPRRLAEQLASGAEVVG